MNKNTIAKNTTFSNETSILVSDHDDGITLYDKVAKIIFKGSKIYIHRNYYGFDSVIKFNKDDIEKISIYKA